MKLVNPFWEHQINLTDGSSTLLIIEDPEILRNYVSNLKQQVNGEEGPFVLSDEKGILKIDEHIQVILSPLELNFSNKKISNKLQAVLKAFIISEDYYQETQEILARINSYALNIQSGFPYNIDYTEIEHNDLLKTINFDIQVDFESEIEKIMEYINILHDICNIDSFIFIGMMNYFSNKTINTFIKEATSNKHNLVFIERVDNTELITTQKIIIDSDSCEIF